MRFDRLKTVSVNGFLVDEVNFLSLILIYSIPQNSVKYISLSSFAIYRLHLYGYSNFLNLHKLYLHIIFEMCHKNVGIYYIK